MTLDEALARWKADKSLTVLLIGRTGGVVAHWRGPLLAQLIEHGAKHDGQYIYEVVSSNSSKAEIPVREEVVEGAPS